MPKWNQYWYGVSPGYIQSRKERLFGVDCLWKKLAF